MFGISVHVWVYLFCFLTKYSSNFEYRVMECRGFLLGVEEFVYFCSISSLVYFGVSKAVYIRGAWVQPCAYTTLFPVKQHLDFSEIAELRCSTNCDPRIENTKWCNYIFGFTCQTWNNSRNNFQNIVIKKRH